MPARITHGLSKHPLYSVWGAMVNRCHSPTNPAFMDYGARGVSVCDEWREDPATFIADMGPKPSRLHTVDRIDNDKGYSPENCQWATRAAQSRNTRVHKNTASGVNGVRVHRKGLWTAKISVNYKRVHLGTFTDFFEAVCARKSAEQKYWLTD